MKFTNKLPKSDEVVHDFLIKNNWTPLKEPKSLSGAIFLSIPLMIIAAFISIGAISIFSKISLNDFGINDGELNFTIDLLKILSLPLLLLVHETLHLIFIPNFLKSKKTTIGLTPFGAFVATKEELLKRRYLLITITPFLLISIILPVVLGLFGLLTPTMKFLIILNAMGSSVDLLNFLLIVKQVPKNATLKNNGSNTYWKIQM